MKIKLTITAILLLTIISCSNNETEKKEISELKIELESAKTELANCSSELTEIKNTAENRFIRAKKLLSENKRKGAMSEFKGIVQNFEGTNDAKIASKEIDKINKAIENEELEKERKKALGYKVLKANTKIKFNDLSLRFEKVWIAKRWIFDDYGSQYFLRDATRGNKHILARVSITSESKNPSLPAILVYKMKDGELHLLGTLGYEFRRWEDYGSYLGNYADYKNDFSHSKTIPFNCGIELSEDNLKAKSIYLVLKKSSCFNRVKNKYGNPEIEYVKAGSCKAKSILTVDDFDDEYVLIKKL